MNVRSALRPISPPSASISLIRCPLAGPPIEGLQGINATLSKFIVKSRVLCPMRAQARAASQPACPAPTTRTSYTPRTSCSGGTLLPSTLLYMTNLPDRFLNMNEISLLHDMYYALDTSPSQHPKN